MERILIIGCSAGGKSTVARQLGEILGIEVIHLDKELWKAGCRLSEPDEEMEVVRGLIERTQWIMDGNYTTSLDLRLTRADTVVVIDFSRGRCLMRAMKRLFQFRGKTRPDMGANCPEELNFDFLGWIWKYPHTERPELLRHLREHAQHATVVELHTPGEVDRWLERVRQGAGKEAHAH